MVGGSMRSLVHLVFFLTEIGTASAQTANSGNNNGNGNAGLANGNGNGNTGNLSGNLSGNAVSQSLNVSRKTSPSIAAPGLAAAAVESCLGSLSGGVASSGVGITIGGTYTDRACNLRLNARTLYAMGHRIAATQILCNDPDVAQALAIEGVACLTGPGAVVRGSFSTNDVASRTATSGTVCQHYDFFTGCHD